MYHSSRWGGWQFALAARNDTAHSLQFQCMVIVLVIILGAGLDDQFELERHHAIVEGVPERELCG
jgi:hypothetical protein